jgi:DNA-binding transcriptional ArsR family regulator
LTRHRRYKDALYEHFARPGKAIAAPKRLELLDLLGQGPRTVEVLAEQAALSVANASRHLQVLRAARLVEAEKKGLYVEYRLAGEAVSSFLLSLRTLAEARLAEVERVTREYVEAVELLRKKGFKAHRMEQGVVDWRARGWRLESERQGANP